MEVLDHDWEGSREVVCVAESAFRDCVGKNDGFDAMVSVVGQVDFGSVELSLRLFQNGFHDGDC